MTTLKKITSFSDSDSQAVLKARFETKTAPGLISVSPNIPDGFIITLQSANQSFDARVSSTATVLQQYDITVVHDPKSSIIYFATTTRLGSSLLPNTIAKILSVSDTEAFLYDHLGNILSLEFKNAHNADINYSQLRCISNSAEKALHEFQGGWYGGGFLNLGKNLFPLDSLLIHDPTLPSGTVFDSISSALQSVYLPNLAKAESQSANREAISVSSEVSSAALQFIGEPSGRFLYIGFNGLSDKVDAVIVDLPEYLQRRSGFFDLSTPLKFVSEISPHSRFFPLRGMFVLESSTTTSKDLYIIDNQVLSTSGNVSVTQLSPVTAPLSTSLIEAGEYDLYISAADTTFRIRSEQLDATSVLDYAFHISNSGVYLKTFEGNLGFVPKPKKLDKLSSAAIDLLKLYGAPYQYGSTQISASMTDSSVFTRTILYTNYTQSFEKLDQSNSKILESGLLSSAVNPSVRDDSGTRASLTKFRELLQASTKKSVITQSRFRR